MYQEKEHNPWMGLLSAPECSQDEFLLSATRKKERELDLRDKFHGLERETSFAENILLRMFDVAKSCTEHEHPLVLYVTIFVK